MEAATDKLLRDLDAAAQTSTTLPSKNAAVGVALRQFREATQLRVALPLTQLDEAREEMGKFIQSYLEELQSQQETRNLIGELSSRITDHRGRVCQLLRSEPLRHPEVVPLILVGMAADRPLESNFFLGLWRDCWGVLALLPLGRVILPRHPGKVRGRAWSSAMREAILWIEQKEVEAPGAVGLPQGLDLCYKEDFLEKQRHQIPPIFLDPLFIPHMAKAVFKVVKPPVVLKALPSANSSEIPFAPNQPEDGGPELEVSELKESTPSTSQPCQQVQEQISEASNTDSDKADEPPPPEEEQPLRSLKVRLPLKLLKRDKATTSGSKDGATPSKVLKESEADEAEATASTGPSEAALHKARFELYEKDLPEVQEVRAHILGLDEGEKVTQEVLNSSPAFPFKAGGRRNSPTNGHRRALDRPPRRRGSYCQVQTPRLQV